MAIARDTISLREGITDEGIEAVEVRPRGGVLAFGLNYLSLLDLVLLLDGVNAILTLNVGAVELLRVGVEGVDGIGYLLPVLLPEVTTVKLQVVRPPCLNQRLGCLLRPAILPDGERRGPGRGGTL